MRDGSRRSPLAAALTATLLVANGCTSTAVTDAGCLTYGQQRAHMPRPLGDTALAVWVATADAAMTGACR